MSGTTRRTGFTLVELMVVLLILGLAAGAVVLAMPDPQGSLAAEAERLAARAKAARDQAIVESRATALVLGPGGYRIERRSDGAWAETARHAWADGTGIAPASARTTFDSTGLAEPLSVTLTRGGRDVALDIGHDGTIAIRR